MNRHLHWIWFLAILGCGGEPHQVGQQTTGPGAPEGNHDLMTVDCVQSDYFNWTGDHTICGLRGIRFQMPAGGVGHPDPPQLSLVVDRWIDHPLHGEIPVLVDAPEKCYLPPLQCWDYTDWLTGERRRMCVYSCSGVGIE